MASSSSSSSSVPTNAFLDDDEYQFDSFAGDPERSSQDVYLERLRTFVDTYREKLDGIADALDDSFTKAWDISLDPIAVTTEPVEGVTYMELARTDNLNLSKIVMVFAHLSLEAERLRKIAREKFYDALVMFGESPSSDANGDGFAQLFIGRMFPFFQELWEFVKYVLDVVKAFVQQISGLYQRQSALYTNTFHRVLLTDSFTNLGRVLSILVTLDELIKKNDFLSGSLSLYRRMMRSVRNDPPKFGTTADEVRKFERVLEYIDGQILSGLLFELTFELDFDLPGVPMVAANVLFKENFLEYLRSQLAFVSERVGRSNEGIIREEYLSLCCLTIFYFQLFKDLPDKNFYRALWEIQRKHLYLVYLHGNTILFPAQFLVEKAPPLTQLLKNRDVQRDIAESQTSALKTCDQELQSKVSLFHLELSRFLICAETSFADGLTSHEHLAIEMRLVLEAFFLATQVNNFLKNFLFLHLELNSPLLPDQVLHVCRLSEMLKSIEQTFFRKSLIFGNLLPLMADSISFKIMQVVIPAKKRLEGKSKLEKYHIDQIAALEAFIRCLMGPPTLDRLVVSKVVSSIAMMKGSSVREVEFEDVMSNLRLLELLATLPSKLHSVCDCTFLYANRAVFQVLLSAVYDNPNEANRLPAFLRALQDCEPQLMHAIHLDDPSTLVKSYKEELMAYMVELLLDPLCKEIETDLRVHIHTVVLGQRGQVLPSGRRVRDPQRFIAIPPIRFFDDLVDVRAFVTHYLSETFYNLTAIALHDWKTYGEMRNLAREKYGLDLAEPYLPSATLEQGLDVLEITRNIHLFVSRYSYDLYNQIFIERCTETDSKHLNTINIRHIANSIRTHGTGIMNTTVNMVYQFLSRKFFIFSQFLFDDHIKSRLIKDIKFFRDNKEEHENMYPLKRAEKFQKDIRKLGLNDKQMSFLDQFRVLITEIGNSMGYVRMVRSGGQHYISNAIRFVPDLEKDPSFEDRAMQCSLSEESVTASRNLDSVLRNLMQKFAEGSDYFKILVSVFNEEMRKEQNFHLRNFYAIVPPLTLSYIDSIIQAKDKLTKKNKDANFCEDGFALGLAFILKLLDQNRQFDSLRWFESVQSSYAEEREKVSSELGSKRKKDDESQHLQLTMNRFQTYSREFDLLFFAFTSARVFFRDAE